MTNVDNDDDDLSLAPSTLALLQEFYAERDARAHQFEKLKAEAEEEHEGRNKKKWSMEAFGEDWNESQFWYADETADLYAKVLLEGATEGTVIVVVSAPSVFVAVKNLLVEEPDRPTPKLFLLEHDRRFEVFGSEFVYYDYARPGDLPSHLKGIADRLIVDPPFISKDCQTKTAIAVRWMANPANDNTKLILSTGERMQELVTTRLYKAYGLKTTDYLPVHARGLSNEFYCYANFEAEGVWRWKGEEK